ncbi:MAG: hypothetical protein M1836_003610 [Candelina mexicana]|nr:MAG: hypothetical protein M1836_003610 [Candelina mexicana]
MVSFEYDQGDMSPRDVESGYVSASSSEESLPEVYLTKPHLKYLNRQLQHLEPEGTLYSLDGYIRLLNLDLANTSYEEILRWCTITLPNLYQTTAFGLTGLVTVDMLSKLRIQRPQLVNLIYLDTLHAFPETLALVDRVRERYPHLNVHVYRPAGVNTAEEFAKKFGNRLWETNDVQYDWAAKVEPAQRAYAELDVKAVLTGRRRSQGGKRCNLDIIEVDEAGLIKVNPLANWTFKQVQDYIKANDVPYNELLDRGYKSIGDWHSTQPTKEGEDERAGRWKNQKKSECGIHNSHSKFAQFLKEQELKKQEEALQHALNSGLKIES